jgi:hypothetical protein
MTVKVMTPSSEQLQKWINSFILKDPASVKRVLIQGTLELADRARVYPTAGPWNSYPGTKGNGVWYERGVGTRYARKGAAIGGKPFFKGFGAGKPSEQLQKNWNTEIQTKDAYSASVYTEVTYAPYLFDPEQRVSWAALHGWQDVDQIAEDYTPRFEEIVLAEIDSQIAKGPEK